MFHLHLLCALGERGCTGWLLCDPITIRDLWNLFPHKLHLSSWYILQKSIVAQYGCRRCNFSGMPKRVYGKMCYHGSRRSGITDVPQPNPFRKNIFFSFFPISRGGSFFFDWWGTSPSSPNVVKLLFLSTLMIWRVTPNERSTVIAKIIRNNRRLRKFLQMTVKQWRLLMLLLRTVKQRRLLMFLLTTEFCCF